MRPAGRAKSSTSRFSGSTMIYWAASRRVFSISVVDPGCIAIGLATLGHDCTGIDFGPASIEYARQDGGGGQPLHHLHSW